MPQPEIQKEDIDIKKQEITELPIQQVPVKMPMESKPSKPTTISVAVLIIVALVVGLVAFSGALYLGETGTFSLFAPSQDGKSAAEKGTYEDGYQAGLDFAEGVLRKRGFLPYESEVKYLYGAKVKSISGNNITVEFDANVLDFFNEGLATKTVIVSDSVKVLQNVPKPPNQVQKDYEEYEKKMEDYRAKVESGEIVGPNEIPSYPNTFDIKENSLSEIKEGDVLNIVFDKDIRNVETLEASSVELLYVPIMDFTSEPVDTTEDFGGFEIKEPTEEPVDEVADYTEESAEISDADADAVEELVSDTESEVTENAVEAEDESFDDSVVQQAQGGQGGNSDEVSKEIEVNEDSDETIDETEEGVVDDDIAEETTSDSTSD